MKTTKKIKIKDEKKYYMCEITDFITKKTYFLGFCNDKAVTKKYASKTAFLNANAKFKKLFNNSELNVVKITPTNKGERKYV